MLSAKRFPPRTLTRGKKIIIWHRRTYSFEVRNFHSLHPVGFDRRMENT
jgi:hypothetical protein